MLLNFALVGIWLSPPSAPLLFTYLHWVRVAASHEFVRKSIGSLRFGSVGENQEEDSEDEGPLDCFF